MRGLVMTTTGKLYVFPEGLFDLYAPNPALRAPKRATCWAVISRPPGSLITRLFPPYRQNQAISVGHPSNVVIRNKEAGPSTRTRIVQRVLAQDDTGNSRSLTRRGLVMTIM